MSAPVLQGAGLTKSFGGLTAVRGVDLAVAPASVTALIGPNGAGKTTLFQCLTGVLRPDAGRVELNGRDVSDASSDARARAGLGRTFQRLALFTQLSVADNLRIAAHTHRRPGSLLRELVRVRPARPDPHVEQTVREVLGRLGLADVADQPCGVLPSGTLRLVELGRALCAEPVVLLLDEPASGLDERETDGLRAVLLEVAAQGIGVLLVEHDVELVLDVSSSVYVLDQGALLAQGTPEQVRADPAVRQAYLGVDAPS